jgi:recombination protein RecR
MSKNDRISELISALQCLPGVGRKTAQRMAVHLLDSDRERAEKLTAALQDALEHVGRCSSCRALTEDTVCVICSDSRRENGQLCVVESPMDVVAIETTGGYRGRYFVLLGHLSPIDGIGPEELGIDRLLERIDSESIEEVVLATNLTVEGEATSHYIAESVKSRDIRISRIAYGVPLGGELEYVDSNTLAHAIAGRKSYLS